MINRNRQIGARSFNSAILKPHYSAHVIGCSKLILTTAAATTRIATLMEARDERLFSAYSRGRRIVGCFLRLGSDSDK